MNTSTMIQPRLTWRLVLPWLVALAGFASMYVPTYWWAATTIWQTEEQAHGALIMLVVAWLFWECKDAILGVRPAPAPVAGWLCFAFGLAMFFMGRLLNISILELGSQIPVLAGAILVLAGRPGIRAVWFPLLYLVFAVPLPGILVDAVTSPLKQWISHIAEEVLYSGGYPIARQGVVLVIGQYQLLVADACSGLHSMFSLSALGVLFLYLKQRSGWLHNGLLVATILPIAFLANVVRVIVLILVTYHFGDDAGQGFLHGGAGMVLMVVALLVFFVSDALLAKLIPGPRGG
jgi:exosortase B